MCFRYPDNITEIKLQNLRPHAYEIVPVREIKTGQCVLMNYNIEYPKERGLWYDVVITSIKKSKSGYKVNGKVHIGVSGINAVIYNCHLQFLDDIFKIKPLQLLAERTPAEDNIIQTQPNITSKFSILFVVIQLFTQCFFFWEGANSINCIKCRNNMDKLCKDCGCSVCGGQYDDDKQLLCDECNESFHMYCLQSPLSEVPEGDW